MVKSQKRLGQKGKKRQTSNKPDGRSTRATTTPERVAVFISALENGLSVDESLVQAGYSMDAHSRLKLKSAKYREQIAVAKMKLTMMARAVVAKKIAADDVQTAKWWLERKVPEEFRPQLGDDGQPAGLPAGTIIVLPGAYPHPRIVPPKTDAKDD